MIPSIDDWLTLLGSEVYDLEPHGHLNRDDRFSAFGLYLDLCGVVWIEHPHSPGTFYPEGATYFTCRLPKEFCSLYGDAGSLYFRHFRWFSQLVKLSGRTQANQLRFYFELDARKKVRKP